MEFDLIKIIRERCAQVRADVRLGIGDDAAILAVPAGHDLVACTDTLVAGVHFPPMTRAYDIGWKSLAVNLSDLAAMGATPAWALLALTLPEADERFVDEFAQGFAEIARQHHVALVGGDTTRGPLSITVVAHGFVAEGQALRRSGAQIGDGVFVTGTLGDAAAGLACLDPLRADEHKTSAASKAAREFLIQRLQRPTPRIAEGIALRGVASACIDVSDGLLADLEHIASASEVGIEIDAAQLPASSALLNLLHGTERLALQAAGGDDYELAFCVPPQRVADMHCDLARVGGEATRIGRVVAQLGVRVLDAEGTEIIIPAQGWVHFP